METLRIAVISSSLVRTPPFNYGSESETYYLARGLARRGHLVTLFCAPNRRRLYDRHNIELRPIPCSYGQIDYDAESKPVELYWEDIKHSDVVIDCSATCVTTEYLHWKVPHIPHIYYRNGVDFFHPRIGRHNGVVLSELAKECALSGTSAWKGSKYEGQFDSYPGRLRDAVVINYGLPLELYEPSDSEDERGDYLLFLGRFHPAKGVFEALELAKKHGFKLKVAGSTEFADHLYYYGEFVERARGVANVEIIADPTFDQKLELLRRAKALIYPLSYREAFGLVLCEALAVNTPVLTYRQWVTPELREGVLELDEENLAKAIKGDLDYDTRRFAERFSLDRMVSEWSNLAANVSRGLTWG